MPLSSRSEYSEKFFQRYYHQLLYFLFYRKRAVPDKRAPLRYILPNKIRGSTRIFFRQRHSGATIFQRFEHPCHISANVFHNLDALHILLRFTGAHTMNGIPIERRNNQRIGQIKIIVHLVKSIHTTGTAQCHNTCYRFIGTQLPAAAIKETIQKAFHCACNSRVVHRGPDDQPIAFRHETNTFIYRVFCEYAQPSRRTPAPAAGHAPANRLIPHLNRNRLNLLCRQLFFNR